MGVAGSVGINIGQNIQAMSMQKLDEKGLARPWTSRGWRIGMWMFIIFSIINFAALAFAPASILTPIESIQFVTNVAFNRIVNKTKVSRRMLAGVGLSIIGTCLSVVCGPPGDSCHTVKQLTEFWSANPTWWFYLALTGGLAVGSYVYHERAMKARKAESLANDGIEGKPSIWLPLSFTLFSALAGGAQMIVHSKVFSELLAALFQGNYSMLLTWLFYIEIILVVSCGILWAFKLTECLGLYDPLVILPLMVGTFILFGGVAGGIFFREFERLHEGLAGPAGWPLYIIGMILVIWGLALIASDSPDQSDTVRNDIDNDTLKLEEVQEVVRDELGRLRYSTRKDSTGWQVEFVDAPGALGPDVPSLHRALWDAVRGAQLALVVVDAADVPSHRQVGRFLDRLARELDELEAAEGPERRPLTALVLNKVDIVNKKERLLKASAALHGEFAFDGPPFMVSAHTGDGVDHLRGWLLLQAKPRQWTMAAGVTHVQPPLTRATEIIREALFTYLDRELPYVLEQRNLGWTELTNPTQGLRIDQQLLIPRERKSVRKILEARLPGIATSARRQLRAEFGRPVFLHLSIGVASNVFELESARPHDVLQMLADRGPDARET
ncbi:pentatricopeptide repeat-containing [Chrysochromulina tobinii]|uniref:Pentatricopeptide repeat-containing n=1 Tax=Chrysochromulina tobinii TaxID=1460289 RepID=A0A0M0LRQ8_9EUKA|nr:pentatricopeptide repeat-containing [Chrysochromulina tobinii]|eukprot:KOO53577.1 pentatricopeptide repeat-containing [Chrysochromulina sp. CCMP291]